MTTSLRVPSPPLNTIRSYPGLLPVTAVTASPGDWVGYGGVGRTPDFEVKLQWDGKPVVSSEFARMELRFVGDGAGFYMANTTSNSAFSGIYNAATNEMY